MKTNTILALVASLSFSAMAAAQTNTFPSSGKAGVGTTSPVYDFEVVGHSGATNSIARGGFVSLTNPSITSAIYLENVEGATQRKIQFRYGASDVKMVLDNSGRLGVGTTSPIYQLEVNGTLGVHDLLRIKGDRLGLENEAAKTQSI